MLDRRERSEQADRLVKLICAACDYPVDRFIIPTQTGRNRKPVGADLHRAEVQRVVCRLLREHGFTLPEIARALGLLDHTTVMYHLRQRLTRLERDLLDAARRELDDALALAYRCAG